MKKSNTSYSTDSEGRTHVSQKSVKQWNSKIFGQWIKPWSSKCIINLLFFQSKQIHSVPWLSLNDYVMFNLQNEHTKLARIFIQKPFKFSLLACVCVPRSCEWFKRKYCENAQEIPPRLINLSIHNRKTHFIRIYCKTRKSEIFSPHKRAGPGRWAPLWATASIFVIHTFSNQ